MAHIYVDLERDADGYPPYDSEELHASRVRDDLWRLEASPAFCYGIAAGDLLRVAPRRDGRLWAVEVVQSGDGWCARVIPLDGAAPDAAVAALDALGCPHRVTELGMVVVEGGPDVDAAAVLKALEQGRQRGVWDFDLGVAPD